MYLGLLVPVWLQLVLLVSCAHYRYAFTVNSELLVSNLMSKINQKLNIHLSVAVELLQFAKLASFKLYSFVHQIK